MSHVGPRLVADVAQALLRAASRLISTPPLLCDTVCESCARTGRREESRRGTQECVRYVTLAHPVSSTSGGLSLIPPLLLLLLGQILGRRHARRLRRGFPEVLGSFVVERGPHAHIHR